MTQLLHARHWIGGEWIDTDKSTKTVDPATGEPVGSNTEAGLSAAIAGRSSDRRWNGVDNGWALVHDETEEGGFKQSGLSRLNGLFALDDFVEYRTFIHDVRV